MVTRTSKSTCTAFPATHRRRNGIPYGRTGLGGRNPRTVELDSLGTPDRNGRQAPNAPGKPSPGNDSAACVSRPVSPFGRRFVSLDREDLLAGFAMDFLADGRSACSEPSPAGGVGAHDGKLNLLPTNRQDLPALDTTEAPPYGVVRQDSGRAASGADDHLLQDGCPCGRRDLLRGHGTRQGLRLFRVP